MRKGDEVRVTDGLGNLYTCVLSAAEPEGCLLEIHKTEKGEGKHPFHLHVAICPTKSNERFDWFLEKATEIGIDRITPVFTDRSERRILKTDRAKKVILAAMKQSLRTYLPVMDEPVMLPRFLEMDLPGEKFIASCETGTGSSLAKLYNKGCDAVILIGPEGDFTGEEITAAKKSGFKEISLGYGRFRTETAGIVACHTVHLLNEL